MWKIGGPLALSLVMIYTAGLNAGSPETASANFLVFAFVMSWSAIISLLPFWKPLPPPPVNENQATRELSEQGFRMGIGTSLALAVSSIAGFAKIGWAPSAVGITIGVFVVIYPFPRMVRLVNPSIDHRIALRSLP